MFRGVSNLTLDAKGRLAIPARYREGLTQVCNGRLIVTIDRGYYLLIYPLPGWQEIEAKLVNLPNLRPQVRELQRLLVGHATEVGMDSHGRVLLPPALREFAKLEHDVVLLGLMNKFELWDKSTWDARRDQSLAVEPGAAAGLPEELARLAL
ncbi:MAG: division/cell wall cluster transcriptional repressor MraZ [Gammaproteobacteria bacterium]